MHRRRSWNARRDQSKPGVSHQMKFDGDPEIGTDLINHYPARFLFGTDEVAQKTQDKYLKIYFQYDPLWRALDKQASEKVRTRKFPAYLRRSEGEGQGVGEGSGLRKAAIAADPGGQV